MARKKAKKGGNTPKPKNGATGRFLKKRAPLYIAGIALLAVFVIPELTKGTLEESLPELVPEEQRIADILFAYDGGDGSGLTVMDAIKEKIEDEYPGEKIYDHRQTAISLAVSELVDNTYLVSFDFESHKEDLRYQWNVTSAGDISSNDSGSRHIINLVDYYD